MCSVPHFLELSAALCFYLVQFTQGQVQVLFLLQQSASLIGQPFQHVPELAAFP